MIKRLNERLAPLGIRIQLPSYRDHARHVGHFLHTGYFSAAFIEAHGMYAILAGVLALVGAVNFFLHIEV